MKAVITVIGKDKVGIIADVSGQCAKFGANIIDITQSVMREYFAMVMLVDIDRRNVSFSDFQQKLNEVAVKKGLEIHVMHEDIFNSMHRI